MLYARSDVASAYIPAESGGCGAAHSRPVIDGAPQHPWAIDCPGCEHFLRSHNSDMWSGSVAEIPESHDEKIAREDFEKRGAKDKDAVLTLALARLAGIEPGLLPESLTRMISGIPAHIPLTVTAGTLECPSGHASPAGQKFCGECGAPMSAPVPRASLPAPAGPAAAQPVTPGRVPRLRDQNKKTLQALAQARGLDTGGSNPELVSRLSKAGVTNADLAAFLHVAA